MSSTSRASPGKMVFHVLNRGVGRQRLFDWNGFQNLLSRVNMMDRCLLLLSHDDHRAGELYEAEEVRGHVLVAYDQASEVLKSSY